MPLLRGRSQPVLFCVLLLLVVRFAALPLVYRYDISTQGDDSEIPTPGRHVQISGVFDKLRRKFECTCFALEARDKVGRFFILFCVQDEVN